MNKRPYLDLTNWVALNTLTGFGGQLKKGLDRLLGFAALGIMLILAPWASATVAVDIRLSEAFAAPGEQTIVEVTLSNDGVVPESNLAAIIEVPADFELINEGTILDVSAVSCGGTGGSSNFVCTAGELIRWDVSNLNPGQARVWRFPVTIAAGVSDGTQIPWSVTVSDLNGELASDSSVLTSSDNTVASLTIDEDQDPVMAGDLLTYTVRYGNTSNIDISGATLSFEIPAGTTFDSATGGGVLNGGEVSWSIGTLIASASGQQVLSVQVDAVADSGDLLSSSAQLDGTANGLPTMQRAEETAYVSLQGAIETSLKINTLPAAPGEQVVISLNVSNTSNLPVADVRAFFIMPNGIDAVQEVLFAADVNLNSCGGPGGSGAAVCTPNEFMFWDYPSLAPGQSREIEFPVTINAGTAVGEHLDWDLRMTDATGAESWRSESLPIDNNAVASLAIDEDKDPVMPGDLLTYTVRYGNTDNTNITNGELRLTLPAGTTFVSATGGGVLNVDVVTWSLGTFTAGSVGQQVVRVMVDGNAGLGSLLPVSGHITGTANFRPTVTRAKEATYVGLPGAIQASLKINTLPAAPGEQVVVSLNVSNTSALPVSDVRVRFNMPVGIDLVQEVLFAADVNLNSCGGPGGSGAAVCTPNEFMFWDYPSLAPGQSREIEFPVTINTGTAIGEHLDWDLRVTDATGAESWLSETLPIDNNSVASLAIDEDKDPVMPGEVLTYTVRYGNTDNTNITNGELGLTLPAGTTFVSATGGGVLTGDDVTWSLGTFLAGSLGQQEVRVMVDGTAGIGSLLPVSGRITGTANFRPMVTRAKEAVYVGLPGAIEASLKINSLPAAPGEQVFVSLNVSNTSALPVSDVRVRFNMPVGIDSVQEVLFAWGVNSNSCGGAGGSGAAVCTPNEFMFWDYASLAPGQSREIEFPVTINAGTAVGEHLDWDLRVTDATGAESWLSETLPIDDNSVASLTIDEDKDPVMPGDVLTYTVRYGNTDNTDITNGQLGLTLPPGTTFISATGGGVLAGDDVTWSLGTVLAGALGQQVVRVMVDGNAGFGSLLPVSGRVTGMVNFRPTVTRAKEAVYVGLPTLLSSSLRVNPLPALPGEQTLVSLVVTNTGQNLLSSGRVRLAYPQDMALLIENTITGGVNVNSCGGPGGSGAAVCTTNEFIWWDIIDLPPGESRVFTFEPTVEANVDIGDIVKWSVNIDDGMGGESWADVGLPVGNDASGDVDLDTIGDSFDNCTLDANTDQRDTNGDGYGNRCDPDVNNDGVVNFIDISLFAAQFNTMSTGDVELTGDGLINFLDFVIYTDAFGGVPGPSAYVP